jgi:hypothetical protein
MAAAGLMAKTKALLKRLALLALQHGRGSSGSSGSSGG